MESQKSFTEAINKAKQDYQSDNFRRFSEWLTNKTKSNLVLKFASRELVDDFYRKVISGGYPTILVTKYQRCISSACDWYCKCNLNNKDQAWTIRIQPL